MLAHSLTSTSTFLTCDTSATALGAGLSQELDGQEKPSAYYASPALTDVEKYSMGEREALVGM